MRRLDRGVLVALGAVLTIGAVGHDADRLALPAQLAFYRSWSRLLKEPHSVSDQTWSLCRPPTFAEQGQTRQKGGPHADHLVMVYATPDVARGLSMKVKSFPAGAMVAKEKVSQRRGAVPEAVAFMIKHEGSEFQATDGWEFRYYPPSGDPRKTHEHCATCHATAQSRDYVLGAYPPQ
jgi:hypothetical protein